MAGRGRAMTVPAWAQGGSVPGASSASSSSSSSAAAASSAPSTMPSSSSSGGSMFLDASGAGLDQAGLPPPSLAPATREALVRSALSIAGFGFGASFDLPQASAAGDAATRPGRRLYVGNLPMGTTEPELMAFFTEALMKAHGPQPGLVVSSNVKPERGFGFIELNSMELATAVLALDGLVFKGNPLKMQRPSDYNPDLMPPAGPPVQLNLDALGIVSTNVPDGPNKVFVGGLPYHFTQEQVKELLQAFGPLRALHLAKEAGATTSKGYAFCEYVDPSVTDQVVMGLNDMEIEHGRRLTVRRANQRGQAPPQQQHQPPPLPPGGVGVSALPTGQPAMPPAAAAPPPPGMAPPMPPPPPPPPGAAVPAAAAGPVTRVLRLSNMTTPRELSNASELAEIEEEVKGACGAHGQVLGVTIPTEGAAAGVVFVRFADASHAAAAAAALGGKTFDGRVVGASFADEAQVAAGVFV